MNYLVIGCGMMGRAVIWDLLKHANPVKVIVVDQNQEQLNALRHFVRSFSDQKLETHQMDIQKTVALTSMFKRADTVVSAVTYKYNFELAKLAVRYGCHFCDLGGNNTIVQKQLALNGSAKKKGVTVIPDCGLAPGMVSILTADAVRCLDQVHDVKIRVGGLPVNPKPPMNYQIVFSVHGLINEYSEPCIHIKNGRIMTAEPMRDIETIRFPKPFGKMEAFNTSGGSSTLPETYRNIIKNLDYKTIRYPGHCEQFRLLMELGFTNTKKRKYGNSEITPREILASHLLSALSGNEDDCILLKVTASGIKNKKKKTITYDLIDYGEKKNGITAMMRMTSFPVSIIAQMLASGKISMRGAIPQETAVPPDDFIREIRKRGIDLKINIR